MADLDPSQLSQPTQEPPPPSQIHLQLQTQEDDIDASLEADIDMTTAAPPTILPLDGATDLDIPSSSSDPHPTANTSDPRVPSKKDASLRDFLSKMDDYAPIVRPPRSPRLRSPLPPLYPTPQANTSKLPN